MKRFSKLLLALVASALVMSAAAALAAQVSVSNSLDFRVSLVFAYTDKSSGQMVTKGWWRVEPGESKTISLNADGSKPIYYAAYNKDLYIDRASKGASQIRRWMSARNFTFTGEYGPDVEGIWNGRLYKVNGAVDINTKPF